VSQENVEIIKRGYEPWSRGDMAAVFDGYHPDVEHWDRADDPDATVRRGRDALEAGYAQLSEAYAEFHLEPKEFIDAGDFVVVPVRVAVRGRSSGAVADGDQVFVYRLQAGKVTEVREYRENRKPSKPWAWRTRRRHDRQREPLVSRPQRQGRNGIRNHLLPGAGATASLQH
jgi:ketosteroid isomerase-like protein